MTTPTLPRGEWWFFLEETAERFMEAHGLQGSARAAVSQYLGAARNLLDKPDDQHDAAIKALMLRVEALTGAICAVFDAEDPEDARAIVEGAMS